MPKKKKTNKHKQFAKDVATIAREKVKQAKLKAQIAEKKRINAALRAGKKAPGGVGRLQNTPTGKAGTLATLNKKAQTNSVRKKSTGRRKG